MDQEKVASILNWPSPTDLKELRGFLDLTGYYRIFIKDYARIVTPLTRQLKKDCFGWDEAAQEAFEKLKEVMSTAPVLSLPDFSQPFVIEADASGFGLGAVLMQNHHPIAYFSKTLGVRGRAKSVYEKELMAIVLAVQKWRHYLLGRHFIIWRDQKSLRFIMDQREVGMEYQRWMSKLWGFDFEIKYKPGITNRAADALSRQPDTKVHCLALVSENRVQWEVLERKLLVDPFIKKVREGIEQQQGSFPGYTLERGQLLYHGRLVIPGDSTIIPKLLHEYHNAATGGHNGEWKTYL